jgi:hypothetical protein
MDYSLNFDEGRRFSCFIVLLSIYTGLYLRNLSLRAKRGNLFKRLSRYQEIAALRSQ